VPGPALPARFSPEPAAQEELTLATQSRRRIVVALRAKHSSELARREAVLTEIVSSGESQEPWTEPARMALVQWRQEIETAVLPVQVAAPRCYAAGCLSHVTFPDFASYEEAQRRTPTLQLGAVGPHLHLPPERLPSGEVLASWAVLRPEPQ
jgi:hypothetical protein